MPIPLPWWNSLSAVTHIHERLTILGYICLAGLLLTEVLAHIYGNRRDALLVIEESSRTETTSKQHRDEIEQVKKEYEGKLTQLNSKLSETSNAGTQTGKRLAEANKKLTDLEERQAPRTVSAAQRERLVPILAEAKSAIASIRATNSTAESSSFAEELREVFLAAGWKADPVFYNMVVGVPVEPGVVMVVNNVSSPLGLLVQRAFQSVGIELKGAVNQTVPSGTVLFIVGQKPVD